MSEKSWKQIREELKMLPRQMCVTPVAEALEYVDEILKLEEQLQSAQQEIERLWEENEGRKKIIEAYMRIEHDLAEDAERYLQQRDKLIEVLRWYGRDEQYTIPHVGCSPRVNADRGQRARNILREIGVTVE